MTKKVNLNKLPFGKIPDTSVARLFGLETKIVRSERTKRKIEKFSMEQELDKIMMNVKLKELQLSRAELENLLYMSNKEEK